MREAPSRRARLLVAGGIGAATVAYLFVSLALQPGSRDFDQVWFGSRALWAGQNPYQLVGPGQVFDWPWPLYYPATALLLASPLALLPVGVARAIFVGGSASLLAYGVTRDSWTRLSLFGSCAFALAVLAAQWSPLLTAILCLPSLAYLVPIKPNIGLGLVAYQPTASVVMRVLASSIGLALLAYLLLPTWLGDWLLLVRNAPHFTVPLSHLGGPLLVLALLRWRRPEARLLLALSVVPQNMVIYATLPLFLIPQTFRESLVIVTLNNIAFAFITFGLGIPQSAAANYYNGDALVALCYLPCLIMILRRPNEGPVPAWIDRGAVRISLTLSRWPPTRRAVHATDALMQFGSSKISLRRPR